VKNPALEFGRNLQKYAHLAGSPEGTAFVTSLYERCGARSPRPVFRLVFLVENRRTGNHSVRVRQVVGESFAFSKTMRNRLWVASVRDLLGNSDADEPIWVGCRDLDDCHDAWQSESLRTRSRLLGAKLNKTPRWSFFPS
jgi:hypothetical protein